jgi:hypothetical protein
VIHGPASAGGKARGKHSSKKAASTAARKMSAHSVGQGGMPMQIGIAAYLRNLAVRCNKIARESSEVATHDALAAISAELADKAEALESTFRVPKEIR